MCEAMHTSVCRNSHVGLVDFACPAPRRCQRHAGRLPACNSSSVLVETSAEPPQPQTSAIPSSWPSEAARQAAYSTVAEEEVSSVVQRVVCAFTAFSTPVQGHNVLDVISVCPSYCSSCPQRSLPYFFTRSVCNCLFTALGPATASSREGSPAALAARQLPAKWPWKL